MKKITFSQVILVALRPLILSKSGRKAAGKYFLQNLIFQGQFGHKFEFLCCELGLIIQYFLSNPFKNTCMAMHNLFCILPTFFLKFAGKLR